MKAYPYESALDFWGYTEPGMASACNTWRWLRVFGDKPYLSFRWIHKGNEQPTFPFATGYCPLHHHLKWPQNGSRPLFAGQAQIDQGLVILTQPSVYQRIWRSGFCHRHKVYSYGHVIPFRRPRLVWLVTGVFGSIISWFACNSPPRKNGFLVHFMIPWKYVVTSWWLWVGRWVGRSTSRLLSRQMSN